MGAAKVIQTQGRRRWDNYHKTGWSDLKRRYALRSGDAGSGRQDIAEGARAVQEWLHRAQRETIPVRPVGGAWSPSNIQTVQQGWMLNTRRYNRCFRLKQDDLALPARIDPAALLLVEGGVQIDEINDRLECDLKRSLRSTGASNGQTIAGACATATHGSVIGTGGIQDHVRAIQIVTPGGVQWVEPAAGLMSDAFIAATGSTPLRDDEAFDAALVAVGSLGIVTAMVIETVPIYMLQPILKLIDLTERDLDQLTAGDFAGFSARHGLDEDPYFVMVVTNPFQPFKRKAVVRFLYRRDYDSNQPWAEPAALGAGYDAFTMLGWLLRNFPWARGWMLQKIMEITVGKGITDPSIRGTWGQTTETHKPLAGIFTGALFCDRENLSRAFKKICHAFTGAGGSTVISLRFMRGGPGLLSPARWPDTVGIDCDGPFSLRTRDAFCAIMATLDKADIPFTRHWGKFNALDAGRVAQDYGQDLVRWKAVRDRLLPNAADQRLFATSELSKLGLTA
jgi:FAD binding domain